MDVKTSQWYPSLDLDVVGGVSCVLKDWDIIVIEMMKAWRMQECNFEHISFNVDYQHETETCWLNISAYWMGSKVYVGGIGKCCAVNSPKLAHIPSHLWKEFNKWHSKCIHDAVKV
jgi:hypothetical protein